MTVKNISTRVQICGRSVNCHGGHSVVEQSSYIGRVTMHSEYDGQTYYPKYSEDLVYSEVMLPSDAPEEFNDPNRLWNSVEMSEKRDDAQLARTFRVELPNEWSYELATDVMKDYVQRNFVDKGMCAEFAIHDSENPKTGQRNLHSHILLTLRSLDEEGHWMPKQKKIYLLDENGERIPLLDNKTGKQKVDKQNRKQWKCKTVPTNDWGNKENVRMWRKDIVDTINSVNEKVGITDQLWEHRSFKEQGLDILPEIHLGEKASALERAGIHSIRGNINRDIRERNAVIEKARAAYEEAKNLVAELLSIPVGIVKKITNEIVEVIHKVAEKNKNRLKFPIVGKKYIRMVSDRAALQNPEFMEEFVGKMGWDTFVDIKIFKTDAEKKYSEINESRINLQRRADYLEKLLYVYKQYEPYIKYNKELYSKTGAEFKKYKTHHMQELAYYDYYRKKLKDMIAEPDKKILASKWQKEFDDIQNSFVTSHDEMNRLVMGLAATEVLLFNKDDLERILENEGHKKKDIYIGRDSRNI